MIDEWCKVLVAEGGINKFVETGILDGETIALVSAWFAEMNQDFGTLDHFRLLGRKSPNPWNSGIPYPVFKDVKDVDLKIYSVDTNEDTVAFVSKAFASNSNIHVLRGNSPEVIRSLLDQRRITSNDKCLFYLDAHTPDFSPLRDEIREILKLERFMLVIDDCLIPWNLAFAYDTYSDGICRYAGIRDLLQGRYPTVLYPVRSNRDNRGWMVVCCGFDRETLERIQGNAPLHEASWKSRFIYSSLCRLRYWALSIPFIRRNRDLRSRLWASEQRLLAKFGKKT